MKDDGAFPREDYQGGGQGQRGMSLRDYFAAKAMTRWLPMVLLDDGSSDAGHTRAGQLLTCARNAYAVADAMMAERAKP